MAACLLWRWLLSSSLTGLPGSTVSTSSGLLWNSDQLRTLVLHSQQGERLATRDYVHVVLEPVYSVSVLISTRTHSHTHTHTHAHTHTHTHTHTRTYAHTHACTHMHTHSCTHTHIHTCTRTRTHTHSCTHTHTHTHARTHAHTHTHHSLPMLEGHTTSEALQNVRDRIWPILKANWALWPAVQVTVTQCSLIPKLQEGRLGMSHY